MYPRLGGIPPLLGIPDRRGYKEMTEDYNQILRNYLNNPLAPEIYKLWYEYLKKNKDYENFWKYVRERKKLPPEQKSSLDPPDELKRFVNENLKGFIETVFYWGDVHSFSWEDKLIGICKRIKENNKILEDNELKQLYPVKTLEEAFTIYALMIPKNYFTLNIPLNAPAEDLIEQFKNIVIEKQKEIKGKKIVKPPFPKPKGRILTEDEKDIGRFKIWLKAYEEVRVKGRDLFEVIQELDPGSNLHKRKIQSKLRTWARDIKNVVDIIDNTGRNIFPGNYGESKRRKKIKTT